MRIKTPNAYLRVIRIYQPTYDPMSHKIFLDLAVKIRNKFNIKVLVMSKFETEILSQYLFEILKNLEKSERRSKE